jgi:hypothetical protein
MSVLQNWFKIIPRLRTSIQLLGLIVVAATVVATQVISPIYLRGAICVGAIGAFFIIFGFVFQHLEKFQIHERAKLIMFLSTLFVVLVLSMLALATVFFIEAASDEGDLSSPQRIGSREIINDSASKTKSEPKKRLEEETKKNIQSNLEKNIINFPNDFPGDKEMRLSDLDKNAIKYPNELIGDNAILLSGIFHGSFELFQLLRNDKGIYRDAARFDGNHFHPASVTVIGMGLISLCIADAMEWIPNAEDMAILTLRSITGNNPPFNPDRNQSGYFRHLIDMQTGERAWNSEYSSIDTAFLVSGALFCKKYFKSSEIDGYTEKLWTSIDWSRSIANPETGEIFREFNADGTGIQGRTTKPFNEYMIVAWLAMNSEKNAPGTATRLWNNFYINTENLPKKKYQNIDLLTDNHAHYLSHFVIQFTYFLCHYFTTSSQYLQYLRNSRETDKLWWSQINEAQPFEWGLGAGAAKSSPGYYADAIDTNPDSIFSPHIIAGFLPTYAEGSNDLTSLLADGKCIYNLPNAASSKVLWRRSIKVPGWIPADIQGVDYSLMLLGLATLQENLGADFFRKYNNFFVP